MLWLLIFHPLCSQLPLRIEQRRGEDPKCAHSGAAEGWKPPKSWERGKQRHHSSPRVKSHVVASGQALKLLLQVVVG